MQLEACSLNINRIILNKINKQLNKTDQSEQRLTDTPLEGQQHLLSSFSPFSLSLAFVPFIEPRPGFVSFNPSLFVIRVECLEWDGMKREEKSIHCLAECLCISVGGGSLAPMCVYDRRLASRLVWFSCVLEN